MRDKLLKFRKVPFILGILCLISIINIRAEISSGTEGKTIKLLTVGNSFSKNAITYLPQIAGSVQGCKIEITTADLGGCTLERHVSLIKECEKGGVVKPYPGNFCLEDLLVRDDYDFVTIQQASPLSYKADSYHPFADLLYNFIKQHSPESEILIHQTWAYSPESGRLKQWGISREEMHERLTECYYNLGKHFNIRILPTGNAFYSSFRKNPEVDLWAKDAYHASINGCYLAGCVWFGTFFEISPEKIDFIPEGMDKETAIFLRKIAALEIKKIKKVERLMINTNQQDKTIGKIKPRSANEISGSLLSIGAETMDRDFTIYDNWKSYLGPLGFKKARILSGWAKTETSPGNYEWDWMDNIVNDMTQQGVRPWVTLCYGNPLFTTFKDDNRGDPPRTEEAYEAWESYVSAFVTRYKDKINEYEIWNEPGPGKKISSGEYATLVIRTTKAIRSVQPDALINILSLSVGMFEANTGVRKAGPESANYASEVLEILKQEKMLDKVNAVTYHPYTWNPDDAYLAVHRLDSLIRRYDPKLRIIQGENGAPSEFNTKRALSNYKWTEKSQAKYGLRRLMGDLGHNIPTSYFSIADMFYADEVNNKALLKARPDKTIERAKIAYYSFQNISSIFDDRLTAVYDPEIMVDTERSIASYLFTDEKDNQIVSLWLKDKIPDDPDDSVIAEIVIRGVKFTNPVYVDMLTGKIDTITPKQIKYINGSTMVSGIKIPDYPVLIAEESILKIITDL